MSGSRMLGLLFGTMKRQAVSCMPSRNQRGMIVMEALASFHAGPFLRMYIEIVPAIYLRIPREACRRSLVKVSAIRHSYKIC